MSFRNLPKSKPLSRRFRTACNQYYFPGSGEWPDVPQIRSCLPTATTAVSSMSPISRAGWGSRRLPPISRRRFREKALRFASTLTFREAPRSRWAGTLRRPGIPHGSFSAVGSAFRGRRRAERRRPWRAARRNGSAAPNRWCFPRSWAGEPSRTWCVPSAPVSTLSRPMPTCSSRSCFFISRISCTISTSAGPTTSTSSSTRRRCGTPLPEHCTCTAASTLSR